ncbi:Hsp20/alpha crystallin family protein [Christiangramia aestuarii]|uniref:Hsp20/alpha crystallin family protein n=1 Tax=Christiangramia aestuarii TaxID=1028746 RepID=A0A7K1LRS6_9FLAO|nr:Hsp20/alpha crystallin family protein [Christiangramia aestuarii]MUP43493.1 Hsp20/alpha crystallin family protein [Christiangramia aestuarii]
MSLLVKSPKQRFPWMDGGLTKSFGLDDLFDDEFFTSKAKLPAMNVKEHEDDFEIEFAVPGFSKEDFEVSIEDDILYVSAEKSMEDMEDEDDYTRREFSYSSFNRTLQLPKSVDISKDVQAKYKNGVLKLKLMKDEKALKSQRKQIDIS